MQKVDDEEDELIDEIDVYLSNDLKDQVFIFQYPLRPNDKPYGEHSELSKVMINQDNSNVKMVYTFENKTKNFDIQYYQSSNFSQNLIGQKIESNTNYCLATYKNNILYLNPVSTFVQFRNDFSHLESLELTKKKVKDKMVNITRKEGLINHEKDDSLITDSKWINLKYYKKDSIQSYQILEKLFFDNNIKPIKLETISAKEYFDFFFSNVNREINLDKNITEKFYSYKELLQLPLNARIETILKKVSIISFDKLKVYCKAELIESDEFLDLCLKCARITKNGHLIFKSELRYDPNLKSELCLKRNFIINLLQNNPEGLKKDEINFIEKKEVNEILFDITDIKSGLLFFKETSNCSEFIQKFKKIYDKEISFWDEFNINKKTFSIEPVDNLINLKTDNTQLSQLSLSSPKFNLDFIKTLLPKYFTSDNICISLRDLEEKIIQELKIEKNQEVTEAIKLIINNMCINTNGFCYLKEVGEGMAMQLRKTLIEYLAVKKGVKRVDIKAHLESLDFSVQDNLLTKVLKSIAISSSNLWSLKQSN